MLRFVIKLTFIKNYTSFEALCNKIIYNIIIIKFKNVQSLTNKRSLMNLLLQPIICFLKQYGLKCSVKNWYDRENTIIL